LNNWQQMSVFFVSMAVLGRYYRDQSKFTIAETSYMLIAGRL
jgi:hypothetical protein